MIEFDEALLDISWKNLESEQKRFKDMDTKAIGIITVVGILMTFLSKSDNFFSKPEKGLPGILFLLTTLFFLVTVLLCILVIRVKRLDILSTKLLIDGGIETENPGDKIKGLIGTIADAEKQRRDRSDQKAGTLKYAIFALGIGVISLILYSISMIVAVI
jgi:hypothetical protein